MSQVDFYILQESTGTARQQFACRLAEKAHGLGHRIYIHTDSTESSRQFDDLLWTLRAGSFLPHAIDTEGADESILIGNGPLPESGFQVLINLGVDVPARFEQFERVVEIVANGESERQDGRRRFKAYRQQGVEPTTHNL